MGDKSSTVPGQNRARGTNRPLITSNSAGGPNSRQWAPIRPRRQGEVARISKKR
jgi:hypothetical protein